MGRTRPKTPYLYTMDAFEELRAILEPQVIAAFGPGWRLEVAEIVNASAKGYKIDPREAEDDAVNFLKAIQERLEAFPLLSGPFGKSLVGDLIYLRNKTHHKHNLKVDLACRVYDTLSKFYDLIGRESDESLQVFHANRAMLHDIARQESEVRSGVTDHVYGASQPNKRAHDSERERTYQGADNAVEPAGPSSETISFSSPDEHMSGASTSRHEACTSADNDRSEPEERNGSSTKREKQGERQSEVTSATARGDDERRENGNRDVEETPPLQPNAARSPHADDGRSSVAAQDQTAPSDASSSDATATSDSAPSAAATTPAVGYYKLGYVLVPVATLVSLIAVFFAISPRHDTKQVAAGMPGSPAHTAQLPQGQPSPPVQPQPTTGAITSASTNNASSQPTSPSTSVGTDARRLPRPRYITASQVSGAVFAFAPKTDPLIEAELTAALNGTSGVFTPEFYRDGLFERVYMGDIAVLDDLRLSGAAILFGCRTSSEKGNLGGGFDENLRRAEVRITCRGLDLRNKTSRVIDVTGVGAGFTDNDALRVGAQHAVDAFKSKHQQ